MRALALLVAVAAPAAAQDTVVTGTLTRADYETYREVPFTVPAGVDRITVTLSYDKADRTVVDLGLWDPARFRGWSGGARDRFTVSPMDASPGYLPGALPPGRWKVVLGVPNIRAGATSRYTIRVAFDRGGGTAATDAIAPAPIVAHPGWYRGDLHMHDAASDGSCATRGGTARVPCPLYRTVASAAAAGLDFIAVSDHNTVSQFGGLRELQPWFDRLLLIPAVEISTFHGHANIFAPRRVVDFTLATRRGIRALQDDAAAAGAMLAVNHPALPSGEVCMGCGWTWSDTDWTKVAAVEAVNGVNATGPLSGTAFWYALLDRGYRLTGIGDSDNHDPDAPPEKTRVGRPTTVVHADALSTPAILAGVRAGDVFVDVEGSRDRLLDMTATAGDRTAAMGGTLPHRGRIAVSARLVGVDGADAVLIVDGRRTGPPRPVRGGDGVVGFTVDARAAKRWFALVVERDPGHPLLIGNPVYLED